VPANWDFRKLIHNPRAARLGAPGPVVADGMLFVGSGYVGTGVPRNVLLAFSAE